MRSYHRPKSHPFRAAFGFTALPLNLRRDSLITRNPELAAAAAAEYLRYMAGKPRPTLLPQRMAFQQWKTGPDTVRRPWWSSTMSWYEMQKGFTHGVPNRVARKIPPPLTYDMVAAARDRGADLIYSEDTNYVPVVARPVRQDRETGRFLGRDAPPPAAMAQQVEALKVRSAHEAMLRRNHALGLARRALVARRGLVRV